MGWPPTIYNCHLHGFSKYLFLFTVKFVYKDHLRDQQNVILITGGLYMQV